MLPIAKLYSALAFAHTNRLFDQLDRAYEKFPETICKMCGTCCADPPPATLVEYLRAFRHVRDNLSAGQQQELVYRAAAYFFLDLVDPDLCCPFLGADNKCLVYEVRPLGCRAYGQLTEKEFEERGADRGLGQMASFYRLNYGINLPPGVLNFKAHYCRDIENPHGKIKGELIDATMVFLLEQDAKILPGDMVYEQATLAPLAYHLASTVLPRGVRAKRPEIMKEYLEQGRGPLLEKYLERTKRFSF